MVVIHRAYSLSKIILLVQAICKIPNARQLCVYLTFNRNSLLIYLEISWKEPEDKEAKFKGIGCYDSFLQYLYIPSSICQNIPEIVENFHPLAFVLSDSCVDLWL
jgi:hypothetical protein